MKNYCNIFNILCFLYYKGIGWDIFSLGHLFLSTCNMTFSEIN